MVVSSQNKTKILCDALDYTDSFAFVQFGSAIPKSYADHSFVHLFERAIESCSLRRRG
jgi:hypothetical protein